MSMLPLAAGASTFDFAQIANDYKYNAADSDGTEGTYNQVVSGLGAGVFSNGGVTITSIAAGGSNNPTNAAHAFFDGSGSKKKSNNGTNLAGLGVCSSGFDTTRTSWSNAAAPDDAVSDCSSNIGSSNAGDDNIAGNEFIEISFDQDVDVIGSVWRNAGHNLFNGTLDYVSVNAGTTGLLEILNGAIVAVNGGDGLEDLSFLSFRVNANSSPNNEVYLSLLSVAQVPLPAGMLLMGTALGGFGVMRRRKTKAA